MLAVDVEQLPAQLPQLGHGDEPAVDAADILAVRLDLPLDQQVSLLIRPHTVLPEPFQLRQTGENGVDQSRSGPGSDQIAAGPLPDDGPDGVHHDGFTCAGLAGEGVEPPVELDICRLDHRDILNMKQREHIKSPPWRGMALVMSLAERSFQHSVDLVAKLSRILIGPHDEDRGIIS